MIRRHIRAVGIAACLALSLLVGILVPLVMGNTFFGAWSKPSLTTTATCALGNAHSDDTSVSVWAGEGGARFLDIIQIGAMTFPDGTVRHFAAWGNGVPNGEGSSYTQVDLGPANRAAHVYGVNLSNRIWTLSIDGQARQIVPDTFRHWRLVRSLAMAEGEGDGDQIGGGTWCRYGTGWHVMSQGGQPAFTMTRNSWKVR